MHGLEEFKYKFYMKWVNALISVDALEQADRTIDMALAIKPTEEARYRKQLIADMIDKQPVKEEIPKPIAKKVNPDPEIVVETDFDEEFSSVLPTITEQIKQGNLVVAWDTLLEYEAKVKQEQNIATIDKKKGEIQQLSIQLYAAGVEAYNQEDYETAVSCFKVVASIFPSYEQTASYLEKSTVRLKLLSGVE